MRKNMEIFKKTIDKKSKEIQNFQKKPKMINLYNVNAALTN